MALKRENRLRRRPEFLRAYEKGRVERHRLFTVFLYERDDDNAPRFGFTVSRKLGRAVARNRLRRRLRAAARILAGNVRPNLDVVVNARHPAAELNSGALCEALGAALAKARALQR